jgi:hypothetical protein
VPGRKWSARNDGIIREGYMGTAHAIEPGASADFVQLSVNGIRALSMASPGKE